MNGLQWFQVMISFAVQATLVLSIAWAVERRTACATAKARVWTACYLSVLLLLAMGVLLPRLDWLQPWAAVGPRQLLAVAQLEYSLGRALLAIWALGAGVMVVRWGMQFLSVQAFIASCPEYPAEVQRRLKHVIPADYLSFPRVERLSFRESPRELGPFCYQFHQPLVFLPTTLVEGDLTELEHVLRHELTHLRTQHPMQLFLQRLTHVVLWFHPFAWTCGRRSSLVREFVCDDAASGDRQSTASYLRTLLRLVENGSGTAGGTLLLGRSQSELKVRARRLAFEVDRRQSTGLLAIGVVCGMALAFSQLWLPTNPLASRRAIFSPWPSWTATIAHGFGVNLRDYETFDADLQLDELLEIQRRTESP